MGFNVGLAFAIGKAAHGIKKGIQGHLRTKSAGSAGLVDPTQSAMVNLMHRERRAMATGTSDEAARGALGRETKNIQRRSILGGKRDLSDYTKFRAANERAIVEGRASERLGMLKTLTDETRNQADRSMDLVELAGERERTYGQAAKQTGSKNFMSQLPALQEMLQSQSDKGDAHEGSNQDQGEKNKKFAGDMVKKVGGAIKGIFGGGGGGGDAGGGVADAVGSTGE
jgi:hypothetical protein